jgi:hypothetical protein
MLSIGKEIFGMIPTEGTSWELFGFSAKIGKMPLWK